MKRWQTAALICAAVFIGYAWGYENGKANTLKASRKDEVDLYAYQRALSIESDEFARIRLQSKVNIAEIDLSRED